MSKENVFKDNDKDKNMMKEVGKEDILISQNLFDYWISKIFLKKITMV